MYFIRWLVLPHFAKEKPVFPVLIPLKQRISLCFHALYDGMVRWMKPRSTCAGCVVYLFPDGERKLRTEGSFLLISYAETRKPA
jgi:hypothetical protein